MSNKIRIQPLDESWKERVFIYRYTTAFYYDVEAKESADGTFCFCLTKRDFDQPVEKQFEGELFSDWLNQPVAFGAFESEALRGVMSLGLEDWNNRLRVAELWVDEAHRHQGVGKALIAKAIAYAKAQKTRSLVLETQTCNEPAIRFYKSCGFRFIGLDTSDYSNEDLIRREVRLEMGLDLPDFELDKE